MQRCGFQETCGTDPVSTGFRHLERMICSQVCPASSSENKEEVGVLMQISIQRHIILQSEITEIDVCGRTSSSLTKLMVSHDLLCSIVTNQITFDQQV